MIWPLFRFGGTSFLIDIIPKTMKDMKEKLYEAPCTDVLEDLYLDVLCQSSGSIEGIDEEEGSWTL